MSPTPWRRTWLCLKKVSYKVYLCENCQRQYCKAFIGLSIRAQMIGGDVPFYVKIWRTLTLSLPQGGTQRGTRKRAFSFKIWNDNCRQLRNGM